MKYFLTGGAGFIGSHLTEKLLQGKNDVVILDNLSTGREVNLVNVKGKIKFVQDNILNREVISKLVSESDYVVHLAAALGVMNIVNKPLESMKTNLQGTELILTST